MSEEIIYVCQKCGKDLGTDRKLKGKVYAEPKGGCYCEKCYNKKD